MSVDLVRGGVPHARSASPEAACAAVLAETERAVAAMVNFKNDVPAWDSFRRATIEAGIAQQTRQLDQLNALTARLGGQTMPEGRRARIAELAERHMEVAATADGTALARAHRLFLIARELVEEAECALAEI